MEGEVEALRKQLEELQTTSPDETDTISDVKKELDEKERALYTLQVCVGVEYGLVCFRCRCCSVVAGSKPGSFSAAGSPCAELQQPALCVLRCELVACLTPAFVVTTPTHLCPNNHRPSWMMRCVTANTSRSVTAPRAAPAAAQQHLPRT